MSSSQYLSSAELFDPALDGGTFNMWGKMADPRAMATATRLPGGAVLIAGGNSYFGSLASAELYDHSAMLLLNGSVLVGGGRA